MNDLSNDLHKCHSGCYVNNACFNHVFCAHDICLIAPNPSGLYKVLNVCANYGTQCNMLFNPVKTQCPISKPKRFKLFCPCVKIGDTALSYISSSKHLGYILLEKFSVDEDMMRQI